MDEFRVQDLGVSENRGTSFWGPYNKDPTFWGEGDCSVNSRNFTYQEIPLLLQTFELSNLNPLKRS